MRYIAAFLIFSLVFAIPISAETPSCSADCTVLMCAETGEVLYEKNADSQRGIASITKVMTALVVCRECGLEDKVDIKSEYVNIEGSSMYLRAGECLTVRELLYGLLLVSGNDAATALACYCAGSVESFADMMNAEAEALGLKNTHFDNPHGLSSPTHYSSAYDMAVITAEALDYPDIRTIASTKKAQIAGRTLVNHNKLLSSYDGAIGMKTGYTKASGRTLISCAERDGMTLIAVTLNDSNDWADHKSLLDYGFDSYELVLDRQTPIAYADVISGKTNSVGLLPSESFGLKVGHGEIEIDIISRSLVYAPLRCGNQVGEAVVYEDGVEIFRTALIYSNSVELDKSQLMSFWERLKNTWYLANRYTVGRYSAMY